MLPAAGHYLDMFDDEQTILPQVEHPAFGAIRLPDGRALAWAEYGSPRGVPCVLIPDAGSSRRAPSWLLHDSALPSSVRLLALDRPGTGASDRIGLGAREDTADDLARLVNTLAVGRVAVIGIGQGADDAFGFAARHPRLVASVTGVSVRLSTEAPAPKKRLRRPFAERHQILSGGAVAGWLSATGSGADLSAEKVWSQALSGMKPGCRALLGDRWKEADFRAAVAADVAESDQEWTGIAKPATEGAWVSDPHAVSVPVHLWHGQQESPTTLAEIRSLAAGRPDWHVSAVADAAASLGYWPQILSTAAASFSTASAA